VNAEPREPRTTLRAAPKYRPVALLGLLYFALMFFVFGLLLVAPELIRVFGETAPGPEQQAAAEKAVHEVFRPRLPIALVLSLAGTAAGAHFKLLPGFRV
jgi:hypothetical protein